jgi:hypothetical protein
MHLRNCQLYGRRLAHLQLPQQTALRTVVQQVWGDRTRHSCWRRWEVPT